MGLRSALHVPSYPVNLVSLDSVRRNGLNWDTSNMLLFAVEDSTRVNRFKAHNIGRQFVLEYDPSSRTEMPGQEPSDQEPKIRTVSGLLPPREEVAQEAQQAPKPIRDSAYPENRLQEFLDAEATLVSETSTVKSNNESQNTPTNSGARASSHTPNSNPQMEFGMHKLLQTLEETRRDASEREDRLLRQLEECQREAKKREEVANECEHNYQKLVQKLMDQVDKLIDIGR